MNRDDDAFLSSIPPFLRRRPTSAPGKPTVRPRVLPMPLPGPGGSEGSAEPSGPAKPKARPDAATAQAAPRSATSPVARAPKTQIPEPRVIDLAARQSEATETGAAPADHRARIERAFRNQAASNSDGGEDVAFQVTLPSNVVRQIRMLAAEKGTTQRAIVLRALRLAGLRIPDGTDIDRRGRTAKRHQQA